MSTLPHTYTDPRTGSEIFVYRGGFLDTKGRDGDAVIIGLDSPDRAVELACAILAAAGDTGFEVVSSEELAQLRRERSLRDSACLEAVRAFRDLAAQEVLIDTHRAPMAISEAIAALPLLPDEPARTPLTADTDALCADQCPRGHSHSCARSPKHYGPHRDVKQKGTENCSWAGDRPL